MVVYAIPYMGFDIILWVLFIGLIAHGLSMTHVYHVISVLGILYLLGTLWLLAWGNVKKFLFCSIGFLLLFGIGSAISVGIVYGGYNIFQYADSLNALGIILMIVGVLLSIATPFLAFSAIDSLSFDFDDEGHSAYCVIMAYVLVFFALIVSIYNISANYCSYWAPDFYISMGILIFVINLITGNRLPQAMLFSAIGLLVAFYVALFNNYLYHNSIFSGEHMLAMLAYFGPSVLTGALFSAVRGEN